ncbi:Uncharacterized protein Rs2_03747 [Raphanus sativus]|nr:Uncharacterized protein Rs2_03747 [Raphanus sativus]
MTNQTVIVSDRKPILGSKTITVSVSNSPLFSSLPTYFTFPPRKFLELLEAADKNNNNKNNLGAGKIASWVDSKEGAEPNVKSVAWQSRYSRRIGLSRLLGKNHSLADTRDESLSRGYSGRIALSRILDTVRSLAITRHGSLSRSYSTRFALSRLLMTNRSLAVTRHDCSLTLTRSRPVSSSYLTNSKSFKVARGSWASNHEAFHRQIVVRRSRYSTRITLSPLLGTARSLAVTRHGSISRRYLAMLVLSPLLGTARSLTVTWQSSFSRGHSARSLAVTQIALSRSLGLLSRGHSDCLLAVTRLAFSSLLGTARSLAVTWQSSFSRHYSTQLALSPLLGKARPLAVTRLALSRSIGAYRSLTISRDDSFVTACSWWYVHDDVCGDLSLTVSQLTLPSITTNSGGSEHCPHRSFTQLSPSKLRLESKVCP